MSTHPTHRTSSGDRRTFALRLAAVLAITFAVASPGVHRGEAAAPTPAVLTFAVEKIEAVGDGCNVTFFATWDSAELRGPSVSNRLYDTTGGDHVLVAGEFRVDDDGFARLTAPMVARGSHSYEFALVRGGQDRVLASASLDVEVSC